MVWVQTLPGEPGIFVGYCYLEDWAQAVEPSQPVLAAPLIEPGVTSYGMRTDRLVVACMQMSEIGAVAYCRISAGAIARLHGEPLSTDWRSVHFAWQSLWREVAGFLSEKGFRVQRAIISIPENMVLLEGKAGFLQYDSEESTFRRIDPVRPETT